MFSLYYIPAISGVGRHKESIHERTMVYSRNRKYLTFLLHIFNSCVLILDI